jgi:hypothetical protein
MSPGLRWLGVSGKVIYDLAKSGIIKRACDGRCGEGDPTHGRATANEVQRASSTRLATAGARGRMFVVAPDTLAKHARD